MIGAVSRAPWVVGEGYAPGMGVTAHFFAFDPARTPGVPTMERLLEWGALDQEMVVQEAARPWLEEIGSVLGDNQKWTANLAGEFAWCCARKHVAPAERAAIDRWLSHLFWEAPDGEGCTCGRGPAPVGDAQVVYDAALITHILSLECSLLPLQDALPREFDGDPPPTPRLHERHAWIYDHDGFCTLVWQWQDHLERVHRRRPSWSLLRWVWV